jgi:hypothetical protein
METTKETLVNEFDIIGWLETFGPLYPDERRVQVKPPEISNVLYFALVWNIFEDELIGAKENAEMGKAKSLNLVKIKDAVEQLHQVRPLEINEFSELLERIKSRYVTDGNLNGNFVFYFRPSEIHVEQLLKEVLLGTKTNANDVVFALLSIAWRLRNNLFHGIKFVWELKEQNDNFGVINQLLATFLKKWKHG